MPSIHTIAIDVIDISIPEGNHRNIAIINQPNRCYGYNANAKEVWQLIQISRYYVYEAGTKNIISGGNYYDYFPEEQPGGGGGGSGDISRYTVEKVTDGASGEVTYKLIEQLNNGVAHAVGDVIGIRGSQMLVKYGSSLTILDTAMATIKEKIDAQYNFTTFTDLDITTSGKNLKQITDELYAKNLPTNTIVTGQLYSSALPFSGNGEAEVMINGPAFWWTCKSLTEAPYSWNAIAGGGSWSGIKMDWTPTFTPIDTEMSDSSSNSVQNKVIKKYVDDGLSTKPSISDFATVATTGAYSDLTGTPTVDVEMSDSSTNAVQNNVITDFVNTSVSSKIESDDYASEETGGTVRTWTTIEDGKTILHISTENPPPAPVIVGRQADFVNKSYSIIPTTEEIAACSVYTRINRCNVADDGTINAFYGDAGYTEDGSNGQVMVYIPKFWYKMTPITIAETGNHIREAKWEISDLPAEGFTLHPAFYDANGNEIDYFLYGAFEAVGEDTNGNYGSYNTTDDMLASIGGNTYAPVSNLTRATARTMATNRGAGWYSIGIKQTMAIQMLFAIEHGFNSQLAVGRGVNKSSAPINTGTTVGNITSGTQDNDITAVNYRGIENMWGNVYSFVDGINFIDRTPTICNSFSFVDDTRDGYTDISFTLATGSVYVRYFGYDENNDWTFLASDTSGSVYSSDMLIGDYLYSADGLRICSLGGRWTNGNQVGIFFFACGDQSSYASANAGARLMYVPTAN